MHYTMNIAGLKRDLPLCRVNDDLYIGAFVIFGDVELTVACARDLLKVAPEHDILITAESKGIPARLRDGAPAWRKPLSDRPQGCQAIHDAMYSAPTLPPSPPRTGRCCASIGDDADYMRGKRVLIVDDVISTGELPDRRARSWLSRLAASW